MFDKPENEAQPSEHEQRESGRFLLHQQTMHRSKAFTTIMPHSTPKQTLKNKSPLL